MMLRFDDFRLDPATLQLHRNDVPLEAAPLLVEVLAYLIEHNDRIIPRQELLERFWPRAGTGGDAALNTCIRRIRSLLGDDADVPRYIQTRPRVGYRFVYAVAGVDASPPTEAGSAEAPIETVATGYRQKVALGALLAVLVTGGALWGYAGRAQPHHRIAIEPVENLCEYVLFPNFNAGLRESLVAQIIPALPSGYGVATRSDQADLHARVSVRQTEQQTVAVLTLVDDHDGRLLWSREFSAATDTEDYLPLQRTLAERMARELVDVLQKRS